MAVFTRILSNAGAPLSYPDGNLIRNNQLTFVLVDKNGLQTSVFDIVSGHRIAGVIKVMTDNNAEFTINIWPNDRGDEFTQYICKCQGMPDIISRVPNAAGTLPWLDFKTNGAVLTLPEVLPLDAHIGNGLLHLSAYQNTLLDGLNQSLTSAEVNRLVGVGLPIQDQINQPNSQLVINTTGGTTVLTAIETRSASFKVQGALTSNAIIVVADSTALFVVENFTTNNFTVTFKTAAGSGVVVPQNIHLILYADGIAVENPISIGYLGSGDVIGPNVSTNNTVAIFDGTTGKLLKDSGLILGSAASSQASDFALSTHNHNTIYDPLGAASTAETNAKAYADTLNSFKLSLEMGETLTIGTPVYVLNNKLYAADNITKFKIIGILVAGYTVGALGTAILMGGIVLSGLTPNAIYYLGAGIISITTPSSDYIIRIGQAISSSVLIINIEDPILLH